MTFAQIVDTQPRPADDGAITQALVRFFAACNGIVGHEANYQVMLAMELERDHPGRVRREYSVASAGRGGIDVLVLDSEGRPWALFEVKGGAYNNRSALTDEFHKSIPKDMATLAKVDVASSRRWVVAVDALEEFGRSLPFNKQQVLKDGARASSVSFAYYGHGDKTCMIVAGDERTRYPVVPRSAGPGQHVDACDLFSVTGLTGLFAPARESLEREADVVATLYRHILGLGYSQHQVATETYFGFAPKKNGSRMQERPDLCLFDPEVQGHFNLYPKGDTSRSYDPLKFAACRVMAEFKGGATLGRMRDPTLMDKYRPDIEKLGNWQRIMKRQQYDRDPKLPPVDFVFVAVDLRAHPLAPRLCDELSGEAQRQCVRFVYVHLPKADRSTNYAA